MGRAPFSSLRSSSALVCGVIGCAVLTTGTAPDTLAATAETTLRAADAAATAETRERRVALVIGIQNYEHLTKLDNPIRDAEETARTLRAAGFEVVTALDPTKEELEEVLRTYFRNLGGQDVGLFYYSGHAIQIADKNYILPADAALASAYDLELQAIAVDTILDTMRGLSGIQLLFLDACRENPFPAERFWISNKEVEVGANTGLAAPKPLVGSFIAYSTTPGDVAYDGAGELSPFTDAFVRRALDPRLEIRQMMARVRRDVHEATQGLQVPWDTSTLIRDFFFVPPPPEPVVKPVHHVDVPVADAENVLNIPRPTQVAGGDVRVRLTALPEFGTLSLDGNLVRAGDQLASADLSRLIFRPGDVQAGAVGLIRYEAVDDWDNRATGIVTIGVRPDVAPVAVAAADEDQGAPAGTARDETGTARDETATAAAGTGGRAEDASGAVEIAAAEPEAPAAGDKPAPDIVIAAAEPEVPATAPESSADDRPGTGQAEAEAEPSGVVQLVAAAARDVMAESEALREVVASLDGTTLEVPVGVGPVTLASLLSVPTREGPLEAELVIGGPGGEDLALDPEGAFLAITEISDGLTLTHRGRALPVGSRVPADDLGEVAVRVAVGADASEQFVSAVFEAPVQVAAADGGAIPETTLTLTIDPVIDPCDIEAGQPFDLQGVTSGRLPNEIDVATAIAACEAALAAYPEVPRFRFQLGRAQFAANDLDSARESFQVALADGHVRAGQLLGHMKRLGAGEPADPEAAIAYFTEGAARGDPYAQHSLGEALVKGEGVEQDVERGLELLGKAVEVGHTYALNELGWYYFTGDFVGNRDIDRAVRFFRESAGREDIYGYHNVGFLFLEGAGVDKDVDRAIDWFERAHLGGHPTAGVDIGLLYEYGRGVPQDLDEALKWYRASAERGSPWGAFNAANLLLSQGLRQETPLEAAGLLALAAARGGGAGPTGRALEALNALDPSTKNRLLQTYLTDLGYDIGPVDGIVGPATQAALRDFQAAHGGPGESTEENLVTLAKAVWEADNPRYDLF